MIVLGYNGTSFQGSQFQKDTKNTIEYELEESLMLSNLLHRSMYHNPRRSGWSRGSRTDKGVHALGNVVSVKLEIGTQYVNDYDGDQTKEENKQRINYEQIVKVVNSNLH